jgi:hypothetical protein
MGQLLSACSDEIVIAREDPCAGRVQVHFPRTGYRLTGQETSTATSLLRRQAAARIIAVSPAPTFQGRRRWPDSPLRSRTMGWPSMASPA